MVILAGVALGFAVALLLAAGLALVAVIALMWQSLQQMSGETELSFEEALSLAAPTAEEEQKRAALRALKDLEYERSVGKISEQDFLELSARYRAEAKRLILAVDDTLEERRRKAEELLEQRLRQVEPSKQRSAEKGDDEEDAETRTPASETSKEAVTDSDANEDRDPPLDAVSMEASTQEEGS